MKADGRVFGMDIDSKKLAELDRRAKRANANKCVKSKEITAATTTDFAEVADRLWAALRHARAEEALRRSEARLAAVFDSIPAGLSVADTSGTVVLMNAAMAHYLPDAQLPSRTPERAARWYGEDADGNRVPATDYPGVRSLRGEHVAGLEMRYTADDGSERWTTVSAAPIRDRDDAITGQVTVVTDIDDLRRLQQRQQLLVAELQHRVRNILAVVRSVFGRTVEAGGTLDDVADHFRGRLDALARTQVIVTQSARGLVDLETLDDLPVTVLRGDGVGVDQALGDAVGAVGAHGHGGPVAWH